MKIKILFIALVFILLNTSNSFATSIFEHYILRYDHNRSYDIELTDNTISWKSLSGPDQGQKETDYMQRKNLSKHIDVIQWTENDGSFVTLVLDRRKLKVISSGKLFDDVWFLSGTVEVIKA